MRGDDDQIEADPVAGRYLRRPNPGRFEHHGSQFDISGPFNVPRPPQGHPVIFQAGDSDQGREFAAATADAIFSRHGTVHAGRQFYADVKGRMARYGRLPNELKILPAATFVLGDTETEAEERAAFVRRQQVSGPTAILFLEHVWNQDLSGFDPDGPLPDFDPDPTAPTIIRGRANVVKDPLQTAKEYRELAEAKKLSIRELMIEVTGRASFVGMPAQVAEQIDRNVQVDAADGFILVPHVTPGGLDEFADKVVPLLQERGHYRSDYRGPTLRDNLELPPARPASHYPRA
jgi:alkanesulfonate monooxygenase SsuD/methylene tetrahydromethanopterin reductase-like flavin-dependent oxidoreductase (luciferase family)